MKMKKKSLFKLLWQMILYKPWLYVANIILWTLIYAYLILPSLFTRHFFNLLSDGEGTGEGIIWVLALIMASAIGRAVVGHFGGVCDIVNKFSVKSLITRNMLVAILQKPGGRAIPVSSGEALNSFRDDVEQAEITLSWLLDTIGTAIFALIAMIILMGINLVITILVFTPLVVVVVLAKKAGGRIEKYRRDSRKTTANIIGILGEVFGAVQGIKVSGAEKNIVNHLKNLNKDRHRMMLKDVVFSQLLNSIYHNTVSLGTGLILLLGARSMRAGTFSIGDFSLFVYYLAFVADFTMVFGDFMAFLKQTEVSFERMAELIEAEDEGTLVEHHPIYLKGEVPKGIEVVEEVEALETLEIKGLNFQYPNSNNGIKGIDLKVPKGSFTVITGRIASGKTTLLKVLLGLLPPQEGEILWNNKKIKKLDDFMTPPRVAYTGQVPHLFSDTVENNILLGLTKEGQTMEAAIHSAALERDIETLEKGLKTVIGPRGMKLSGGQIQRVAAARMFYRNPELYVFDDLSSALDLDTEMALWDRLSQKKKATCLVVSNKKAALKKADHIVVLKEGKIEAQGSLMELLDNSQEFRQIWGREGSTEAEKEIDFEKGEGKPQEELQLIS